MVAPGWALKRAQARAALSAHYDAAASGRRTDGWGRGKGDANAASPRSIQRLRDLSRDLVRNDPTAKRAKRLIANHAVGTGITPMAVATSERIADRADAIWRPWSQSLHCDYDQQLHFAGLQHLVMRTLVESGAALVLRVPASTSDRLPASAPVRVRVLEPDHLDHEKDSVYSDTGNPIVQGIETDGRGRRVAYWLYPTHPGARSPMKWAQSVRVPAEDVIHIYDVDRPGQFGGVPWMDAVIAALNDLGDFKDAQRMLMKVASCMVGVVEDMTGLNPAIGEQSAIDDALEFMEPGQFAYLRAGQSVKFNTPPTPVSGEFVADSLRDIAAGMGLTYEALSNDFRRATFSSARMARQEHRNDVNNWREHILIPKLCDGVWRWVMELAAALEGWPEVPTATWTAPPLPSVEPDKEPAMFRDAIRSGLKTPSQALREHGVIDFDAHVERYAKDVEALRRHGLIWDSDAAQVTGAGILQLDDEPDEPEGPDEPEDPDDV